LHAILLKKLQEFIRDFLQGVLSLFPESMQLGALNFPLGGVSCTHRIKVGGSFGANLVALAEVVSEGEIELTFSYGSGAGH
jgi:hypothetical protein